MQSNNIQNVKKDISNVAKKTTDTLEDKFSHLKERGKEIASNIEDKAYEIGAETREVYDKIEHTLKDGVSNLENQIKNRPLLSAGIAVLIGLFAAKFISKK